MKKSKMIIVVVLIITVVVGIGDKVYMDRSKKEKRILSLEKRIASYIKDNYRGIKKIEFTKWSERKETGRVSVGLYLNDVSKDENNSNVISISINTMKDPIGFVDKAIDLLKEKQLKETQNIVKGKSENVKIIYNTGEEK